MRSCHPWLLAWSLFALSPPAAAQSPQRAACFRPAPLDECRGFVLFEVRGQSPFQQPYRSITVHPVEPDGSRGEATASVPVKELSHSFGWDVGYAVNVAPRWAVGATVGLELAEASRRHAAALRLRRWLTDDVAVELVPGIFRLVETGLGDDPDRTGVNAALRLALWDIGVVALRYDRLSLEATETRTGSSVRVDPGGVEENWSVGVGLESMTGLLATGAGALALAAALMIGLGGIG